MPFLSSLLLFLMGLALLIVALRARPKARLKRLEDWEEHKMELGARICRTAARDAFQIDLDHSDESLSILDRLITEGWTVNRERQDSTATAKKDTYFVFASYIGDVLRRHHGGEWQLDAKKHKWPYLFFKSADLSASPFDILDRKLKDPHSFALAEAVGKLFQELERRKHIRATTWHSQGDDHISFGNGASATHAELSAHDAPHTLSINPDEPSSQEKNG